MVIAPVVPTAMVFTGLGRQILQTHPFSHPPNASAHSLALSIPSPGLNETKVFSWKGHPHPLSAHNHLRISEFVGGERGPQGKCTQTRLRVRGTRSSSSWVGHLAKVIHLDSAETSKEAQFPRRLLVEHDSNLGPRRTAGVSCWRAWAVGEPHAGSGPGRAQGLGTQPEAVLAGGTEFKMKSACFSVLTLAHGSRCTC